MSMLLGVGTALWLGILTSISPCPLATNIAAISYIARKLDRPGKVLWTGLLYTLGRCMTYVVLAMVLVVGLSSMPVVSHVLQTYMNRLLGPILVVAGMLLLELITFGGGSNRLGTWIQQRAEALGLWGALFLGIVFALSFCPVSAALYFGSLLPLALKYDSAVVLPLLYSVGTALPVFAFAIALALGAQTVSKAFARTTALEKWARPLTGILFIGIGIIFTLKYTLNVL